MKRLALFDFDGTITKKDSLIKFIRYTFGDLKTVTGLVKLSPVLLMYKLKIIPNYKAKEILLSYFFKGMKQDLFETKARDFSLQIIDDMLRAKAMQRIDWHKRRGDKVMVVSASIESWLKPWCDKNGIELIATRMEVKDTLLSGRFLTKNCYGSEKVNRLKHEVDLTKYDYVYGYGDSKGDKELLELADESYYKPFHSSKFFKSKIIC